MEQQMIMNKKGSQVLVLRQTTKKHFQQYSHKRSLDDAQRKCNLPSDPIVWVGRMNANMHHYFWIGIKSFVFDGVEQPQSAFIQTVVERTSH